MSEPTDAQKQAGNYTKHHTVVHGLPVTIENLRGSKRSGVGKDGKPWSVRMPAHYGYFKNSEGADGDHVDCYLGPAPKSKSVTVIDQKDADTGKFDEHKAMLCFSGKKQAIEIYKRGFSDGRGADRIHAAHEMDINQFKDWLKNEDTTKRIARRASGGRVQGMADGGIPAFDPSKPFEPVAVPAFDPSKPFEPAADKPAAEPHKFGWSDTWPARIAKSIASDVTLPRDVATHVYDTEPSVPGMWSDEDELRRQLNESHAMRRVGGLMLLGTPLPAASRAGVGWMGVPKTAAAPEVAAAATEAAAREAAAREFGVPLSRGQSRADLDAIRYEDMASRNAYGKPAQDVASKFFEDQYAALQQAGRGVGETVARDRPIAETPSAAASTVSGEVGASAAEARAIREAAERQAEQEAAATRGMTDDQAAVLRDVVAEGRPAIENPREAGEMVGQAVRSQAARDRAEYQRLYGEATSLPGEFHAGAFEGIGNRIQGRLTLGENPVIIDDVTTPVASRAIKDLDNISHLRIQNRADPFGQPAQDSIVAVDLRGVDQARKRLVAYYRSARSGNNAADARATGRLIDEFDEQIERSIADGLFSGDPRALEALQQARAAYSSYARTYRPRQAGDDVGTAMRRIIDRQATPEEISNMIVGSGRLGNAGLPVRIADRLENVLGRDSEEWSAIRQAVWQRGSQVRNQAGEIDPIRSANAILDMTNSSLGMRMFNAEERQAMRAHAQGVRELERTIEGLPATQTSQRARNAYQNFFSGEGIGGSQATTFRRIVEGTATPEETAQAVFGAIGSGNPGNASRMIDAIERIVGRDSDAMSAIRQGVWQKITQNPIGKDQPGQQKIAQAIGEFLNGRGKTIAEQLYNREELDLMRKYADVVKMTIIPPRARTNSDTAVAAMSALHRYGGAIMGLLGGMFHGVTGGIVKALINKGATMAGEAKAARRVSESLSDLPTIAAQRPPMQVPSSALPLRAAATQGLPNLGGIQGTLPVRADQQPDQQQP